MSERWKWEDPDFAINRGDLVADDGRRVLWAWVSGGEPCVEVTEDRDARLIAAAPEMLALLRDLEWSAPGGACVDCGSVSKPHHDPICKLGNLLARIDAASR